MALITAILTSFPLPGHATHIRAGEIRYKRVDPLTYTYQFTFVGHRDTRSGVVFGRGTFSFGDGRQGTIDKLPAIIITPVIVREEWVLIHTYSQPGRYIVSFSEPNRNKGIANITESVASPFYVDALVVVNDDLQQYHSPVLTVPPVDEAAVKEFFIHNVGAFDADGDVLTYEFVVPRADAFSHVSDYLVLNDPSFYLNVAVGSSRNTPALLTIDPDTGNVVWDAPGETLNLFGSECGDGVDECAEYSLAIRVTESRANADGDLEVIGYVTRDMQIIVYEGTNNPPLIIDTPDVCGVAGDTIVEVIRGLDPDGNMVRLEMFGGPFQIQSPASYLPNPPAFSDTGQIIFSWTLQCSHVRKERHSAQIKISDLPQTGSSSGRSPSLVNFDEFNITVNGPSPAGLTLESLASGDLKLSWEGYFCASDTRVFEVFRKIEPSNFQLDPCIPGLPDSSGFQLIGEVGGGQTTYTDSTTLENINYCYRIVARFQDISESPSLPSSEVCLVPLSRSIVITSVDIEKNPLDGSVLVGWKEPDLGDSHPFQLPFSYSLEDAGGQPLQEGLTVTMTSVDTDDYTGSYRVVMKDNDGVVVTRSALASTVMLSLDSADRAQLTWSAQVPWNLTSPDFPVHRVWRSNDCQGVTPFVEIAQVVVARQGFNYRDAQLELNLQAQCYSYYVETFGTYSDPSIPAPLINRSHIIQIDRPDRLPPCAPIGLSFPGEGECIDATTSVSSCDRPGTPNNIAWEINQRPTCSSRNLLFDVYYSHSGQEADYTKVGSTGDLHFTHQDLASRKGCYKIRSSSSVEGTEAFFSSPACIGYCPYFELPNVITPNGDGKNDLLVPMYDQRSPRRRFCPESIDSVFIQIFDPSGNLVFTDTVERPVMALWDGSDEEGKALAPGVYYYRTEVKFDTLMLDSNESEQFKGWIQVLK